MSLTALARRARLPAIAIVAVAVPVSGAGGATARRPEDLIRTGLPLRFVPNAGQTDPAARFHAETPGGTLFFTPSEVVLALPQMAPAERPQAGRDLDVGRGRGAVDPGVPVHVVRLRFLGAEARPEIAGAERLPGTYSSFRGQDSSRWRSGLPTYGAVEYRHLYPGIDLRYEGVEGRVKGTYRVEPGADPSRIRWTYAGAEPARTDRAGNLRVASRGSVVMEEAPAAWQESAGRRRPVAARYDVAADGSIGFALPDGYDRTRPLVIDPTLTYSTFLGGGGEDVGYSVAVDASGAAYVTGYTLSVDFPTKAALDPGCGTDGNCDGFAFYDAFVAKLNPLLSGAPSLVFSTYLGGSGNDFGVRIAVDGAGASYVTGLARASFPTTPNAFQPAYGGAPGADAFLAKLSADGSQLLYSTYFGGSDGDGAWGIALDATNNVYITGRTLSVNFPTTLGALDRVCGTDGTCNALSDAFVAKFNLAASGAASLVYSTYLGGSSEEQGFGIAVDASSNAYVTGRTSSTDFPTAGVPYQAASGGDFDAFVVKLNAAGSALTYATYFGGSGYEDGYTIALGSANRAYVVGTTFSANLPTTAGAFQSAFGGLDDAYFAKLDPAASGAASLIYSTYVGGNDDDEGFGLAVDGSDVACVAGFARSPDLPVAGGAFQPANGGVWDAFVTKVNPALSGSASLLYSTYLGGGSTDAAYGLALDSSQNIYVTGQTFSSTFPTANAFQGAVGGGSDAFVVKIDNATAATADLALGQTDAPDPVLVGSNLTYTITVTNGGPAAATGVRVTDIVLGSTFFVSATPTQGSCTALSPLGEQDVSCTLGSLASGATASVSVVVAPYAAGTITSNASVASNLSDPGSANNTDSESTIAALLITDLSITKTDGQSTAVPGSPVTYTIVASNAGPSDVTGATVADTVPGTITAVAWTCVGAGGGSCAAAGTGSIDETVDLPVGGTVTFTLTGTVAPSATGNLSNTATVAVPDGDADANLANDSATDTDSLLGPMGFFTLQPCRVVDTRGAVAPNGGPAMSGQQTRAFVMTGSCGIPATAKALSLNVTVTQATANGFVTLFPAGQPRPLASSINYPAGRTLANNAIIALDAVGRMAAFAGQGAGTTVHVIIDVVGYFQ
jgi:uncharacterized repeat protein (TIGR01451 family)